MKTIYLVGFMGAGKTTIGRELEKQWNLPFYDTDEEVVKTVGKSISDIFATMGETTFRNLETDTLKKLPIQNALVTTGGGIIQREENCHWMMERGIVIFLDVSPQEVLRRLANDSSRPLLNREKEKSVHELLALRLPIYKKISHYQIKTDGKTSSEIIQEIQDCLK